MNNGPLADIFPLEYPGESVSGGCATSTIVGRDTETGHLVLVPSLCNQWKCPLCSIIRAKTYTRAVIEARPNTKIELTLPQIDPRDSLADCVSYTISIPKIVQQIRRRYGPFEFLYTFELFEHGGAHVHLAARSPYIPQPDLSAMALRFGLGPVVWIRAIKANREDVMETVKYLYKASSKDYANLLPSRRVRRSRKFLAKPISEYRKNPDSTVEFDHWSDQTIGNRLAHYHALNEPLRAFIPQRHRRSWSLLKIEIPPQQPS